MTPQTTHTSYVAALASAADNPTAQRQPLHADLLRGARLNAGATVADIAAAVGVSTFTVFRWESGAAPQPRFLLRLERVLAELLNVTSGARS